MHIIVEAVEQIQKHTREKTNLEAIATAKLTAAIMRIGQSLGGSPPPDSLESLLPFPSNTEVHANGKRFNVSKATATKFFELVSADRIPSWAAGDLVRYTRQWKSLANS